MNTQPVVFQGDLDDKFRQQFLESQYLAVDTETLGLNTRRDRLCVVQMCNEHGQTALVQILSGKAPNLKAVLEDPTAEKIFHYARFDLAALKYWLHIEVHPIFCTKIASKLARTYTDRHGLKSLLFELLNVELDKVQQSSDWAAEVLSPAQVAYAASDVTHLIPARKRLEQMLHRENRLDMAKACFQFLPHRVELDLAGWGKADIFSHA